MIWNKYPDKIPPVKEDFYAFTHSQDVLCYDGEKIRLGYLQVWEDNEYPPQWKQSCMDAWDIGNVTHWMDLPLSPNDDKED